MKVVSLVKSSDSRRESRKCSKELRSLYCFDVNMRHLVSSSVAECELVCFNYDANTRFFLSRFSYSSIARYYSNWNVLGANWRQL